MGHLLLMVRREPGVFRSLDAARRLQDLVPTWTSTQPGSHIIQWARLVGLVSLDDDRSVGRLVLTDDGYDYAAALPDDFETVWKIQHALDIEVDKTVSETGEERQVKRPVSDIPKSYDAQSIVDEGSFLDPEAIADVVELLRRKKNLILQGPPGTGKTWLAKRLGYALIGARDPGRLVAIQFQPSLSYEDFVRGWRPDGKGGLKLTDGTFLEAIIAAQAEDRPYILVIEEINRGNPAQILGELLTLIEDGKRDESEALRLAYPRTLDETKYVPGNLYIIGTMNLADRSLALVDLALRRRFAFVTLAPTFGDGWRRWCASHGMPKSIIEEIAERLLTLNAAIAADRSLGTQFQVGHSFVTPVEKRERTLEGWRAWYTQTVETEIAPLLSEYWFDNQKEAKLQIAGLRLAD